MDEVDIRSENRNGNNNVTMFKKKLKYLYKKIDSTSSLLWSHECHLTGAAKKRLRSKDDKPENILKWKNKATQQTGYGEIAMSSMTSLLNLFQNVSKFLNFKIKTDKQLKDSLIYKPEDYNMNTKSTFLDIGSGFGKPVFHSGFQVGCISHGIEVVPARAEFSMDFFYEFLSGQNFFEEIEKKVNNNTNSKSDDDETVLTDGKKYKNEITTPTSFSNLSPGFTNTINLNDLNPTYYQEVINSSDTSLEVRIFSEVSLDESYIKLILQKRKDKLNKNNLIYPIVKNLEDTQQNNQMEVEEQDIINQNGEGGSKENTDGNISPLHYGNFSKYSKISAINLSNAILKYGNHFILQNFNVKITPIDDHVYSNLLNTLLDSIYTGKIDREIFNVVNPNKNGPVIKISDIVDKIENRYTLELILFVNAIFINKHSYLNPDFLNKTDEKNICSADSKNTLPNDFYDDLKKELQDKEKLLTEVDSSVDEVPAPEDEVRALKETLVGLKFHPLETLWYENVLFYAKDATNEKAYATETGQHYTHIYSYNKLMNKECRSKIAKILNKTKFKILAWYSNPKQTKKAGLKNFTFLCKFPMQSTSTEKFHVYVYIKN